MATTLGKRARRLHSMNRHQLKRVSHTNKSPAKRRRAGWGPAGKLPRS